MQIKSSPRINYNNNPLVEVLCQVRFDRILSLQTAAPEKFQEAVAERYPSLNVEQLASFQLLLGPGGVKQAEQPGTTSIPAIYHFTSVDMKRRVSITADSLTFSCAKYDTWEAFSGEFFETLELFSSLYPKTALRRVGLRYKDLIEREALGLAAVPWSELLANFLAGPLAADNLFSSLLGVEDEARIDHAAQSTFRLEACDVLLQGALMRSADQPPTHAFLIDTDFFHDAQTRPLARDVLPDVLKTLHETADDFFQACIKPKLHDALSPTARN